MLFSLLVGFYKKLVWAGFFDTPTAIWSTLGISTEFTNITKWNIGNGTDTGKCQWLGVLQGNFLVVIPEQQVCGINKNQRMENISTRCFRVTNAQPWVLPGAPQVSSPWAPACCWSRLHWAGDLSQHFSRLRKSLGLCQQWRCWTHMNQIEAGSWVLHSLLSFFLWCEIASLG